MGIGDQGDEGQVLGYVHWRRFFGCEVVSGVSSWRACSSATAVGMDRGRIAGAIDAADLDPAAWQQGRHGGHAGENSTEARPSFSMDKVNVIASSSFAGA